MTYAKALLTLAVLNAAVGWANAIECYVCRGCATVGPDDIQTCSAEITTDSPGEPVTDSDTLFDGSDTVVQVAELKNVPWLEEAESKFEDDKENGYVLVNSELPGAEKFSSRSLKQAREGEEARCVLALFQENGAQNVVRSCSTASDDDNLRCSQAIGANYTGDVQYCRLCDEDLCNSASKIAMGATIITIAVSLSYYLL